MKGGIEGSGTGRRDLGSQNPANWAYYVPAAEKPGTGARSTKLPSHGFFFLRLLPVDQVSGRTVGPWGSTEGSWRTPPPMGRRKGKCPGPGVVRVQFCLGRDYCRCIFMQPCDYEMSSKHLFPRCKPCCSASRFDLTLGGRRVGGQPPPELFF